MCDCGSKTVTVEAQLSLLVMEGLRLFCPGRECEAWLFCCWSCWAVRPYGMLLLLLLGLRAAADDAVPSMAASTERRDCLAAAGAAGDAAAAARGGCIEVTLSSDAVTACCRSIWANGELETDSVLGTGRMEEEASPGAPVAVIAATPPVADTAAPAAVGVEARAAAAAVWPVGCAEGVLSTPADLLRLWCGLGTGTAAAAASTSP